MAEPGHPEIISSSVTTQKTPELGEKFLAYFNERIITQEGFLKRDEWQKKLSKALQGGRVFVGIIDLVGSGNLITKGKFSERMENVLKSVASWRVKENQKGEQAPATLGRKIEIRERNIGEDEVLVFIALKPNEDASPLLQSLQTEILRNDGHNAVYIGCSDNSRAVKTGQALRGADIALKEAKEKAKKQPLQEESKPTILINNGTLASIDKETVDPERFVISPPDFSDNVILDRPIEKLRQERGNFTIISPDSMKIINEERGMAGGDQILTQLSEKISGLLTKKGKIDKRIYKIGTVFAVPNCEFFQEDFNFLAEDLPYGLMYSEVNK